MMPTPNPMKKKVLIALSVVVIGHVGMLWGLNHMKTPELKPIEKEPLKVRFVKIQEPPKPLPPQPKAEPKKEQPAPPKEVKEVKVVETPPPPPKKAEKVQQVKKAEVAKPVVKPVEAPPVPTVTSTVSERVVQKAAPVVAAPVAPPAPPAPPAPAAPKSVSIGGSGVQWSRSPRPSYTNQDLRGEARTVVILIEADEKGTIVNARVTQSSGVSSLDSKVLRAVKSAKFKPYKENGVAYAIRAEQPFSLTLNPNG
jgi:periplasmic protein TonB